MKKIAIITGGPGYERDVALRSSKLFEKYINREYETFILPEELDAFIWRKWEFEKVIPVFHWEYWEDGRIQALLDIYNIPYVGSSYFTNALCMNKRQANTIASSRGILVPKEWYIPYNSSINRNTFDVSFPLILKPNTGGSSCYTYKIWDIQELQDKLIYIWEHIKEDLLLQEYILWDEYSVSVVNREILDAIMFVEKQNKDDFFDFQSKYENETIMKETFPILPIELKNNLIESTKKVVDIFSLEWYARVDYIVRWEKIYFLEVNTIPGSTEVSILPKAWKLSWRTLEEFVDEVISYKK